jgi:PAS domain S-box-containing protein
MRTVEFQDIYENAPCGYILLQADGIIVEVNHLFLKMAGLSRDAVLGINFRKLLTSAGAIYYDTQILPQLLLSGVRNEIALDLVRSDGQRLPVLINVGLRRDAADQPCEIRIILMQASERRQYERELLRSRKEAEQMAEVVFHSSDAIIALRPDGHIKNWNSGAAEMFGFAANEAIGKPFFKLISLEEEPAGALESLHQGQNIHTEAAGHHRSGRRLDLSVSLTPHLEAPGTLVAFSAIVRDITLQKLAERALLQSEKLASVGRLASSIAHEINNPLESVTNLLYLARHSKHLDEIQSYLELAERELRRVSAISNQTLRFHKQSTSPQDVTAESLIESVLLIYQGRIVNSQVKVEMRLRAHAPVKCFEGEIRQVLSNLVSNAIDAMSPRGGRLRLRCRTDLDWKTGRRGVVITVADTGAGMARETLRRLFEPFYTTKGNSGTGLGLWVSRQIVDRHRGKIWVRSCQVPGRSGTVFTVFLPFTAATRD